MCGLSDGEMFVGGCGVRVHQTFEQVSWLWVVAAVTGVGWIGCTLSVAMAGWMEMCGEREWVESAGGIGVRGCGYDD